MTRVQLSLLAGILVLCLAVAGGYFWTARRAVSQTSTPSTATLNPSTVLAEPRIVFRNVVLGPDYSKLAMVSIADPGGPRAVTPVSCERVYATAGSGVCVSAEQGVAPTYAVSLLDAALRPTTTDELVGLPSRARMSADGSLVSTTTFVSGHSYAQTTFSTQTVVRRNGRALSDLETWTTTLPNGTTLNQIDRNYWGVTFAGDDDTFFATAASGGTTWLVRGSLRQRTMTALRTDAECPSLSPDGTRIAYKKRLDQRAGTWRLAVLDLATNHETLLAETRSVDDQVEWFDGSRMLYALPRSGSEATTSDVWSVAADGSGAPAVLIEHASSPAVVRT
ncbi:MAG TPA: hypothetical protein VIT20_01900 [Propionibacteriaceae bacterium]